MVTESKRKFGVLYTFTILRIHIDIYIYENGTWLDKLYPYADSGIYTNTVSRQIWDVIFTTFSLITPFYVIASSTLHFVSLDINFISIDYTIQFSLAMQYNKSLAFKWKLIIHMLLFSYQFVFTGVKPLIVTAVSSNFIYADQYCLNQPEFEAKVSALTVDTPTQTWGKGNSKCKKELGSFHIIFAQNLTVHNICLTHIRPSMLIYDYALGSYP